MNLRKEAWNLAWFALLATALYKGAAAVCKLPAIVARRILR